MQITTSSHIRHWHPYRFGQTQRAHTPACLLTKWLRSRRQYSAHHGSTWAAANNSSKGCIAVSNQSRQSICHWRYLAAQQRCCATHLQRAQRVVGAMPVTVREEAHCTQQWAGREAVHVEHVCMAAGSAGEQVLGSANVGAATKQLAWHHAQIPFPTRRSQPSRLVG